MKPKIDRRFYVYVHRRKSDGRIFYVGKGNGDRQKKLSGRNIHWKRVAEKHGWTWEIPYPNLSEACAHSIEKMLIFSMRAQLTNITNGGEGVSGLIHTAETKRKMVENRGPCVAFWTGKKMPEEMKQKFREAKIGKRQSAEHAQKSRTAKLGKKHSQGAIDALRERKSKAIMSSDGKIYPSASEAARQIGGSQGNISMCARGARKNAHGLSWRYI